MVRNLSWLDRSIRLFLALLLLVCYLDGVFTGITALCLMVGAAFLVWTCAMGACPVYFWLHWTTQRRKHAASGPS